VIALAQHGVEYALATLGTATTATHAQKLLRITDTVVFCFDGDDAGRKAAWRALENVLPVLADGKAVRFLFLPDGEDPDDYIRRRGKAAFEALVDAALPLSDFLLSELSARHPPTSAEGRAALVTAAKPLLSQIVAPVLSALIRHELARTAGLPERELAALVPAASAANPARARPASTRSPPSLARELIKCLLLAPQLARKVSVPTAPRAAGDEAALAALVAFCTGSEAPLTTAGLMQQFAGGPHEPALLAALLAAEDEALVPESLEIQFAEGVKRYWLNIQKRGDAVAEGAPSGPEHSAEETERARQRTLARQTFAGRADP
jgi:DNA primase